MLAYSSARLAAPPPAPFAEEFLSHSCKLLDSANACELSHFLLGLAAWQKTPEAAWLSRFWVALVATSESHSLLKPAEIGTVLRASAQLSLAVPSSVTALLLNTALDSLNSFSPQQLSLTLWALVRLNEPLPETTVDAFVAEARRSMPQFSVIDLSQLLLACAELRHRPSDAWLSAAAQHSLPKLSASPPLALVNLLWACAVIDWLPHRDWLDALSAGLQRHVHSLPRDLLARSAWSATALQAYALPVLPELWQALMKDMQRGAGSSAGAAEKHAVELRIVHEVHTLSALEAPGLLFQPPETRAVLVRARQAWLAQQTPSASTAQPQPAPRVGLAEKSREISLKAVRDSRARRSAGAGQHSASRLASVVASALRNELGLAAAPCLCPVSLRAIDLALPPTGTLRLALQIDGPWRFTNNAWTAVGSTVMRDRALALAGWRVLSLPFFSLDMHLSPRPKLVEFLRKRLAEAAATHLEEEESRAYRFQADGRLLRASRWEPLNAKS
jgi:hypothetical protein